MIGLVGHAAPKRVPARLIERELAAVIPGALASARALAHDDVLFALALPTRGPRPMPGAPERTEEYLERYDRRARTRDRECEITHAALAARGRASHARWLDSRSREPLFGTRQPGHERAAESGR